MPRTTGKKQKIKKSNNKYYVVAPNGREIPVPETVTVNRDEELAIDTEASSYVVEVEGKVNGKEVTYYEVHLISEGIGNDWRLLIGGTTMGAGKAVGLHYAEKLGAGAAAKWLAGQAIGRLAGALPSILFSPARGGEHFVDKTLDDGKRVMYIIGVK